MANNYRLSSSPLPPLCPIVLPYIHQKIRGFFRSSEERRSVNSNNGLKRINSSRRYEGCCTDAIYVHLGFSGYWVRPAFFSIHWLVSWLGHLLLTIVILYRLVCRRTSDGLPAGYHHVSQIFRIRNSDCIALGWQGHPSRNAITSRPRGRTSRMRL